jgi:hypothetical protein
MDTHKILGVNKIWNVIIEENSKSEFNVFNPYREEMVLNEE